MKTNEKRLKIGRNLGVIILAFIAFMLDQMTKLFVVELSRVYELNSGIIQFHENTGIAFGIPIKMNYTIATTILLMVAGLYLANRHLDFEKHSARFLVAAVLGGAAGNLLDRIAHGYVVDFISIWKWPVFNLADVFITVGIFSIVLFYDKIKKINNHSK
jgi:signal peptidase II